MIFRTNNKWITLATALLVAVSMIPALGHIVPPEKLHPVAEAYRRATFVLNLNPVQWEVVKSDVTSIASTYKGVGEIDNSLIQRIDEHVRANDPSMRGELTREVFVELTRGVMVVGLVNLRIATTAVEIAVRDQAVLKLREAQGILASFDDAIRVSDPEGYKKIGQAWLTLHSSLGSQGLLGQGGAAMDREQFEMAVKFIEEYYSTNYGNDYKPVEGKPLAPWPTKSPTFNPDAKMPIKLPPGSEINKQLPRPRQILGMASRGVDESETALIAMGDMGFDSPFIFGEPARSLGISCNTCHNKSITNPNLFIPGLSTNKGGLDVSNSFFAPHANNGLFDPLDTPDLRGIRFTAPYGRNGRFASLREFTRNVIVNEFNGPEPSPVLLDGMMAYMMEFEFLSNPALDANGQLTAKASDAARRGEPIFRKPFPQMGNMSCASCHIPEANFLDHKRHDIGTVKGHEPGSLDRHMDTPTLLSAKHTAPYMHDGSQPTLRAVNEWLNDQYGLNLTERELADLTAYVETVGDGVDPFEDTMFTLEAEMEEFSFFLSAYEFLAARGHSDLISATFQTVALEIRAHKWDLQDWAHMPTLDRMAQMMDEAYAANEAGDRAKVETIVAEYRKLYAENAEVLK